MPDVNPTLPSIAELNATADSKTLAVLATLISTINNLDQANLAPNSLDAEALTTTLGQALGVNQLAAKRRGVSTVAGTDTRANTAYGTLGTPDQVTGIVLPADGLIAVCFQATWACTATGAKAAVFLGANQTKAVATSPVPVVDEATYNPTFATQDDALETGANGLQSFDTQGWTDVTTGRRVGVAYFTAAAGTYDVSVQFKAPAGTVSVRNRKLRVWTLGA